MEYVRKAALFMLKGVKLLFLSVWDLLVSLAGTVCWIARIGLNLITVSLLCLCVCACLLFIKLKPELDECMELAYDKIAGASEEDFMRAMDTYVYDKDENTIGIINAGNFEYVTIDRISMNIQNIYISQEDQRFKEHTGVDWISTIRAGLALLKNGGEITQGGSTITQQVVKNVYLTQEKSFKRKIIEILMAPQLEKKFSKTQIMEYYCNTNFYGNRCYGVQAASQYYFGKDASDVTVAEAAMLAGLSNNPTAYDPVRHYDDALGKRNSIIRAYCENGYITEEERDIAIEEKLVALQQGGVDTYETYQSSYAVHCAALKLMEADGFRFQYTFVDKEDYDRYTERYDAAYNEKYNLIRSGGYHIHTSLDSGIQAQVQESIDSGLAKFNELQEDGRYAMQGAAVVTDNASGYIVAIVGGRGTSDQYNRAYLSARQPGSAIKPLIDYAPAFDTGLFYPSKVMVDQPIENGPENSGGGYRGAVTLREAVNRSINTIAWQVLQQIGVNDGLDYLGKMRFLKISYVDNGVDALSIGGFTNGVRVVDMAKGYQTLANGGEYNDRTCIVKMLDSSGKVVIGETEPKRSRVYEADSAYMMTDVLKGTLTKSYATGYGLALENGVPAAGKTGTTNNNRDTWFCGYTKYYTTAVWAGYDTPRDMPGIFGATYAGPIWKDIMDRLHAGLEVQDWERPDTVYESNYDPSTGVAVNYDTGAADLFSSLAQERGKRAREEQEREDILETAERDVQKYERKTIAGPEDTYTIEADFMAINNEIAEIDDTEKRVALYNRIYEKYRTLLETKESMTAEIAMYEKQRAEEESVKASEEESSAEAERERFVQKTRETEVEAAIERVEKLEYQPEDDSAVKNAQEKLELIEDYDSFMRYAERLEKAAGKLKDLPTRKEYWEKKAAEESEKAAKEESEAEERAAAQKRIEEAPKESRAAAEETKQFWDANTNGPGSYNPNYGPWIEPGTGSP